MSDQPDKEAKTEHPSERRQQDAVDKGNIPVSSEPGILTSLLAISAIGTLIAAQATSQLAQRLGNLLGKSADFTIADGSDAFQIIMDELWGSLVIAAPVLGLIALGGIIGPLGQNTPQANLERIMPKAERLSPRANFGRIFGKQALIAFGKTVLKMLAVSALAYWALSREFNRMIETSAAEVGQIPSLLLTIFNAMVLPLCIASLVISVADVLITRFKWIRDLMMTKQELKDEHKQSEGDPAIKAKILQAARQRARSRMMAELPRATLVIANPTHYAVALRYVPSEGGAPLVIAKGIDHLALRIRETCEGLSIPVVENKPLARSLHAAVEVGEMIPEEFYRAVAEVVHFVNMKDLAMARRRSQG